MARSDQRSIWKAEITRRQFLAGSAMASAAVCTGCAINPVTGKQQLMLVSEQQEIGIDRQYSPHQISADYGVVQGGGLTSYLGSVAARIIPVTHRPSMPYKILPVNAVYVNAYAFPGGTIALTRGILLSMESEAALASLLGHEIGHVNARHTAQQMSKGALTGLLIAGATAYIGSSTGYGQLASQLGQIGSGALLAKYSRDNERESDDLGLEYMVAAGYNPQGQVQLMDALRKLRKRAPSSLDLMFATHPLGEERYRTVQKQVATLPPAVHDLPLHRERYMDNTADLRALRGPVEKMQEGQDALGRKEYEEAAGHFDAALREAPEDYAGLLLMAKSQYAMKKFRAMDRYAERAKKAYPGEAQAYHVSGMAKLLDRRNYSAAYADFTRAGEILPGNPEVVFFRGLCLEQMGRRAKAAELYAQYLQKVNRGENAQYAAKRLREWGYIR